jgi:hypothetical protein
MTKKEPPVSWTKREVLLNTAEDPLISFTVLYFKKSPAETGKQSFLKQRL